MKLTKILTSSFLVLFFAVQISANDNRNIVEVAVGSEGFNTLTTALTEADLVEALQGAGPFTVFAPTDEAFANLPEGALENLLNDKEALKEVLLYHVVKGKIMAEDVVKYKEALTLSGKNIDISVDNNNVMLNKSKVVATDISASNGVIHVIDTVLLPPATTKN